MRGSKKSRVLGSSPGLAVGVLLAALGFSVVSYGAMANPEGPVRRADEVDVQVLLGLAEQGDARAAYLLGTRYASGRGGIRDDSQALRWFKVAAQRELAEAQYNLGIMYANGRGVPKDMKKAIHWFQAAAEQGLAGAQYNLGTMYVTGNGLKVDYFKGVEWLRKAAEQEVAGAQFNLGLMLQYGKGVKRNLEQALRWYHLAEAQGFPGAKARADKLAPLFPAFQMAVEAEKPAATSPSPPPPPLRRTKAEWFKGQDPKHYTIQILGSTAEEDVRSFIVQNKLEDRAAYFRTRMLGKIWYSAIYGLYSSYKEAEKARKSLPPGLRKGKPWSRRLGSILEIIEE